MPTIELVPISQVMVVAEYLSFHRAAKVLGVQQSAINRRVRARTPKISQVNGSFSS
jgi:hypothetical protein